MVQSTSVGVTTSKNGNASRLSQQQQTQPHSRIPKLTETIIVENDIERTMQKRAKALLNKLWSPEFLLKLYHKLPKDDDGSGILINDIHCLHVKDMCFYLQEKKEIPYWEYKDDNIDLYLPRWIATWCNENRRQSKKNNIPDEALTCNVCDRSFATRRLLGDHQQKKRHFGCSACDSLFPSLMALEHHKEEFQHWSDSSYCSHSESDDSDLETCHEDKHRLL